MTKEQFSRVETENGEGSHTQTYKSLVFGHIINLLFEVLYNLAPFSAFRAVGQIHAALVGMRGFCQKQ